MFHSGLQTMLGVRPNMYDVRLLGDDHERLRVKVEVRQHIRDYDLTTN